MIRVVIVRVMKRDMEKRMSELRVLERRLDVGVAWRYEMQEESEPYKKKREEFKQQIEEVNSQLVRVGNPFDD